MNSDPRGKTILRVIGRVTGPLAGVKWVGAEEKEVINWKVLDAPPGSRGATKICVPVPITEGLTRMGFEAVPIAFSP